MKKLTPEGHETLDEEMANEIAREARRGPFRFSKYGIPVGAKLGTSMIRQLRWLW